MKQYQGNTAANGHQSHIKPHAMHSGSAHLRPRDNLNTQNLSAIPEPEDSSARRWRNVSPNPKTDTRTILRVDAFLGEWLSPDYFENITSPPGSKMMVAGAKADLLRRGDPIDAINLSGNNSPKQGHFPGGWGSEGKIPIALQDAVEDGGLGDLSSLSQNLPKLGRANTFSSGKRSGPRTGSKIGIKQSGETGLYVPPIPSYAISPAQPIPQGYVAHARDACVNVDYQWDSLRSPLGWGSGGEYGEEWSSMHKRFRKGLHEMISYYRNHDPFERPEDRGDLSLQLRKEVSLTSEDPDDDVDTILVLITHGAGCNALIGALTNQPVLIDVGMASLTMAVRKNVDYKRLPLRDGFTQSPTRQRRSSLDSGDSEEYDVKLVASTDHLRPGSHFLTAPQRPRSPSMPVREKSPYRYERHVSTLYPPPSSPLQDIFSRDSDGSASSSNLGQIRRSATTAVPSSGGLWTKPVPKAPEEAKEPPKIETPPQVDGPASTSNGTSKGRPKSLHIPHALSPTDVLKDLKTDSPDGRSLAQTGLWGAPPHALATERERGAKRRWTLSQAG